MLKGMFNFKDSKVRTRWLFYGGAAIALLLFITPLALTVFSTPRFCASCHEMSPAVDSWRKSSHAESTCYACHGHSGIDFLLGKMQNLKELYYHVTGDYEKPINAEGHYAEELEAEICNRCHAVDKRKVTPSKGIIINHAIHEEKGVACTKCHNRVAHPDIEGYEDWMEMIACFRCHSQEAEAKAPGKCSACHPAGFELKPGDHAQAQFLPPKHAELAEKDMDYCSMCHAKKFCLDCHGMEIPHPTAFEEEHGDVGKKNPEKCAQCHREADFCTACHHEGYKADIAWTKRHPVMVKSKGADTCFKCHGPTYCSYCHVRGKVYSDVKGP